jgi:hypothetical protein
MTTGQLHDEIVTVLVTKMETSAGL